MTYLVCRLLPALVVALVASGCSALDRRPEPASQSAAPGMDPAAASVTPAHEVRPVAVAADASTKPLPEDRQAAFRPEVGLQVFGLSYHPNREGIRLNHLDNERNFGLGLNYEFHNDARGVASVEAGFFKDSGRNWAKFAGPGYQFKLGNRWRVGADLLAFKSQTYNSGRVFVAPIPRLTYDLGAVKLNAVYTPRFQQYSLFAAFAFYVTIPIGNW